MISRPNVCHLVNGLRQLRVVASTKPDTKNELAAARQVILQGVDHLSHFSEWERTPHQINRILQHIDKGHHELALPMIDAMLAKTSIFIPRFRIVLFNETAQWINPKLVKAAGEIYAAYLYDENQKIHIADIRPSYELTHLYNTASNRLSGKLQEQLQEGTGESEDIIMYCAEVDKVDWRHKHFCGEPCDPGASSYRDLEESELEYYRGNVAIELPQPAQLQMVLCAVDQQLLGGNDLLAVASLKATAKLPEMANDKTAILAAVTAYQIRPDVGELRGAMVRIYEAHLARDTDDEESKPDSSCSPT